MIEIYDNFIPHYLVEKIDNFFTYNHPWYFSMDDENNKKFTLGTAREKRIFNDFDRELYYILKRKFDVSKIQRVLCNCFRKSDRTVYHQDPGELSYMLYLNSEWKEEWGSPTLFKKPSQKIYPKPGRLVVFSSKIFHRGTAPNKNMPDNVAGRFSMVFHEGI